MKTIPVADIPVDAIVAARNAMADEYCSKTLALEKSSLVIRLLHKRRITEKIMEIGRYLSQLDEWIKEIKK